MKFIRLVSLGVVFALSVVSVPSAFALDARTPVPELAQALGDRGSRDAALRELATRGLATAPAIPALVALLVELDRGQADAPSRANLQLAICILAYLGPPAREALPALSNLLMDDRTDYFLSVLALRALRAIDLRDPAIRPVLLAELLRDTPRPVLPPPPSARGSAARPPTWGGVNFGWATVPNTDANKEINNVISDLGPIDSTTVRAVIQALKIQPPPILMSPSAAQSPAQRFVALLSPQLKEMTPGFMALINELPGNPAIRSVGFAALARVGEFPLELASVFSDRFGQGQTLDSLWIKRAQEVMRTELLATMEADTKDWAAKAEAARVYASYNVRLPAPIQRVLVEDLALAGKTDPEVSLVLAQALLKLEPKSPPVLDVLDSIADRLKPPSAIRARSLLIQEGRNQPRHRAALAAMAAAVGLHEVRAAIALVADPVDTPIRRDAIERLFAYLALPPSPMNENLVLFAAAGFARLHDGDGAAKARFFVTARKFWEESKLLRAKNWNPAGVEQGSIGIGRMGDWGLAKALSGMKDRTADAEALLDEMKGSSDMVLREFAFGRSPYPSLLP